jgi:hypothetical protein
VTDTPRVLIGVILDPPDDLHRWLAQATAFDAAGADALFVDVPLDFDPTALVAALAAMTTRSALVAALPEGPARDTVATLSRGRLRDPDDGWERTEMPEGRVAWATARADAAERGVPGLMVPADPRLLDLLRNPDDQGDRSDLRLSVG